MSIDGVKFRKPVEPGVLLRLEVEFVQKRARVCKFAGRAMLDGEARHRVRVHGDDRRSASLSSAARAESGKRAPFGAVADDILIAAASNRFEPRANSSMPGLTA